MNGFRRYAVILLAAGMWMPACEREEEGEFTIERPGANYEVEYEIEKEDKPSAGIEEERAEFGTPSQEIDFESEEVEGFGIEDDSTAVLGAGEVRTEDGFFDDELAVEDDQLAMDDDQLAAGELDQMEQDLAQLQDEAPMEEDIVELNDSWDGEEVAVADDEAMVADETMAVEDETMIVEDQPIVRDEYAQADKPDKKARKKVDHAEKADHDMNADTDIQADDDLNLEGERAEMDDADLQPETDDADLQPEVIVGVAPAPAEDTAAGDDIDLDEFAMEDESDIGSDWETEDDKTIARIEEETGVREVPALDDEDYGYDSDLPPVATRSEEEAAADELDVFGERNQTAVLGEEEEREMHSDMKTSEISPPEQDSVIREDSMAMSEAGMMDESLSSNEPNLVTPVGMGFTVGGGVNGYLGESDDFTTTGGNWEARYILGTRTIIGGELAYIGTANGLDTLGVADDAVLVTNGAEGNVRINFATQEWQPYVTGGVGWKHFDVTNTSTNTSAIRDSDDALTVPVGAGLAYRMSNVYADIRGTYRPAFLADITRDSSTADTNLDTLGGSLNIGFEF